MHFNVIFTENDKSIDTLFNENNTNFCAKFDEIVSGFIADFGEISSITQYVGGEKYEGDYIVTPKVTEQTILTKNKVLLEDVSIKEIPFYNVSNSSGGNTVFIGDKI